MLRIERDARGVATLILDRPAERNALDAEMVERLTGALSDFAEDRSLRVVRLAAAGPVFCAGADIAEMRAAGSAGTERNEADARRFATLLQRLERLPQPTVAVVHGAAYGGALGLIAACDIAVAAASARFTLSEVRLGLIPAMISPYVVRAIGARQAQRWFLSGETMDAATAGRLGLVHEVAEDQSLAAAVAGLTDALLAGGPAALAEAKRLLRHITGRGDSADQAMLADTARWIAKLRASPEGVEGLTAFLERRKPGWIRGE